MENKVENPKYDYTEATKVVGKMSNDDIITIFEALDSTVGGENWDPNEIINGLPAKEWRHFIDLEMMSRSIGQKEFEAYDKKHNKNN